MVPRSVLGSRGSFFASLLCITLLGACAPGTLSTDGRAGGAPDYCMDKLGVGRRSDAIVHGTVTTAYPAVGFLSNGGGAFCTATLIGDRMVVTAAHCVESGGVGYFNLGNSDRAPTQRIRVTRVTIHPAWDTYRLLNDIAVLEIASNPTGVEPLPVLFDAPERGWASTLVGFGVDDGYRQSGLGTKREVGVTIASLESTTWSYRTSGGGSACNGDSGGPAFYQIPGGPLAVMGITSYGDEYCVENGFYTRLDLYRDFLPGATEPPTGGPGEDPPPGTEPPPGPPGEPSEPPDDPPGDPPADPPPGDPPTDPPAEPPTEPPGDPGDDEPPAVPGSCTDTCGTSGDGECDDGGSGALCAICAYATDCGDCGPR